MIQHEKSQTTQESFSLDLECDTEDLFKVLQDCIQVFVTRADSYNIINIPEWMSPETEALY